MAQKMAKGTLFGHCSLLALSTTVSFFIIQVAFSDFLKMAQKELFLVIYSIVC